MMKELKEVYANRFKHKYSIADAIQEYVDQQAKKKAIALLGLDTAWPLPDVLDKLINAAEILLHKDYDGNDYEEIEHCIKKAKEFKKHWEQIQNKEHNEKV